MPSLYDIKKEILECLQTDPETGEVTGFERFEELVCEQTEKRENIILWIKNLRSDAVAFKAEEEAFAKRRKSATALADRLENYLCTDLEGQKFSTERCAISFRPSESVNILDKDIIPKKFMVKKISIEPDKTAIKNAIKAGIKVKGAEIITKLNPQIK